MRIALVVDAGGAVIGTARLPAEPVGDRPVVTLEHAPGQTVYEVELPKELERVESALELHAGLQKYVVQVGESRLVPRRWR